MLFLKDLNIFHLDAKEIPCITAPGAPDTQFPGAPGSLYMDIDAGQLYLCTAIDISTGSYFWKTIGDIDTEVVRQAVDKYLLQQSISGGGISAIAIALLITILQNAVFTSNQTANIAALQEALATTGDALITPDNPDVSDDFDKPVADDITVADGIMTIVTVGSAVNVAGGVMTIA